MIPRAYFSLDEIAFRMAGIDTEEVRKTNRGLYLDDSGYFKECLYINAPFDIKNHSIEGVLFDIHNLGAERLLNLDTRAEYPLEDKFIEAGRIYKVLEEHTVTGDLKALEIRETDNGNPRNKYYDEYTNSIIYDECTRAEILIKKNDLIEWANKFNVSLWLDTKQDSTTPTTESSQLNTATGEHTQLKALGLMAYLLYQRSSHFRHGSKPNAEAITKAINNACATLQIESVSEEIRKDITKGWKLIKDELPPLD